MTALSLRFILVRRRCRIKGVNKISLLNNVLLIPNSLSGPAVNHPPLSSRPDPASG